MDGNITINIVEPGTPPSPTPIDPVTPNTGLFTSGTNGPEATIITAISAVLILTIVAIVITSLLYRKQKKSGKVTKLVHLVDSTKAVLKSNKHITTAVILLAILTSTGTFIALARNAVNASESDEQSQTEGTNDSNLTVDVSSEELTIEVGDTPVFAILPVDVTVEEATQAGYTLTASTNSTDLVSTTDSSKVIPMVAADEGELVALANNTYGLALEKPTTKDEAVYTALSTDLSNPTILKAIDDYSSTPANDTTTIYYGFYITPDTPYGTYTSSDIYYNATTNSSKVIFHSNGLDFNNNPEQTTNNVEYITGITSNTVKYSHTPNINDEGVAWGALNYGVQTNQVVTIPGAATLHVMYTYGGGYQYGQPFGYGSFWYGSHPDYTPNNNYSSGIQNCGGGTITDGKYYSDNNTQFTVECDISGDTATFGYWTSGGGPGSTATSYGYYTVVTGYDADGNIIYLPGNTQVGGEYKDPAQDLPYIFLGWNEDKEATTATYESKNDIELNLPLVKGKTTELYAIWQHATKIHFDGNGSTSGEIPDKLLAPGKGTSLCGYYYSRDGYVFNNWNTRPDGSGVSYGDCDWYTAPADQSIELNLYAQWTPVTTIIYDGNGGEGNQQRQTIRAGETGSIYNGQSYFSRDGYIFSHWNTESDGTGTSYYGGQKFTAPDQSQVITLYAQWIGNVLDTGTTVNAKLKRLAGNSSAEWDTEDTNVTTIARASDLPTDFTPTDDNTISINGSTTPVYAWYDTDTTTIYYYTESEKIIMNPDSSYMFYYFSNLSDATSIADWDTSSVTNMYAMFNSAGSNVTTFSLDLSSWDTSKVTSMSYMFNGVGYNATTWSIGDLSSWDTSKVTSMSYMLNGVGYNATTWSIGDISSWDTSNVTDMSDMFSNAGYNATTFSLDLSSWDTSKVTDMSSMFSWAGYNVTTFSLDLSSWDTSKVTSMGSMFNSAGYNATTWSVTIPQKTGDIDNTTSAFYGKDSSVRATPPSGKSFTLASQANSNTTNTTESLNSVNNVETPIQGGSSRNYSVYATEDAEDTENDDNTGPDTTSTPSRQEPLGEYQSSTTTSTKDTNIIIPILIVAAITLGTSTLGFLIYKSLRQEDE